MLKGMSELCIYEFEDTAWDEFCRSDDHIGPHPSFEHSGIHSNLGNSHKKPRTEITKLASNTEDRSVATYVDQRREENGFPCMSEKRSMMLDKGTLSQTSNGVYPSSSGSDSVKEASTSASDNDRSLCHGLKSNDVDSYGNEFCDTILNDKTSALDDNNSFNYHLEDIAHTGNNLDFLANDEEKDSNEFLFYGWPEIGNFEDVDKIFSNCDSTFGLEACKEDNLGWFSSSVENDESPKSCSVNDFANASGPIRHTNSSWAPEKYDPYSSFVNGPLIADKRDEVILKEQTNELKKQPNLRNRSMERTEEQYYGNGSFCYASNLSNEVLQQQQASGSIYSYQQNDISYTQTVKCHLFNLNPSSVCPVPSAGKSEVSGLTSISPRDSSHASTQFVGSGKREKLHSCQGSLTSTKSCIQNTNMTMHDPICDSGSVENKARFFEDKFENHSDIDGVSLVPAELVSSNVQESSTMSSGLDDISLEAASFRQLQLVTEQLDLRTKLCIRDSLYRLAQSAEQRHNHANFNGALLAEGTKNFMDMETATNPIDRSIAHLLFHRPSESSAVPIQDSLLLNSPAVRVHGSVTNAPGCEKTASRVERVTDG